MFSEVKVWLQMPFALKFGVSARTEDVGKSVQWFLKPYSVKRWRLSMNLCACSSLSGSFSEFSGTFMVEDQIGGCADFLGNHYIL